MRSGGRSGRSRDLTPSSWWLLPREQAENETEKENREISRGPLENPGKDVTCILDVLRLIWVMSTDSGCEGKRQGVTKGSKGETAEMSDTDCAGSDWEPWWQVVSGELGEEEYLVVTCSQYPSSLATSFKRRMGFCEV